MLLQKSKHLYLAFLLLLTVHVGAQQPVFSYLNGFSFNDTTHMKLRGPARVLPMQGRKGINMTSIRSVLELKAHNLKSSKGTVTVWVMSLEELSSYDTKPKFGKSNPNFYCYPFLSDCSNQADFVSAHFKLTWTPRWHPSLITQFGRGTFYEPGRFYG